MSVNQFVFNAYKKRSAISIPFFFFAMVVYGILVRLRLALYGLGILKTKKLRNPVISVGNLTVGGTGKTPLVELTAQLLRKEEENVVILSRGYGRANGSRCTLVSDGNNILTGWKEAGDEPFLLASNLPGVKVVVGNDRYRSGKTIEQQTGDCVFLLDDGYQHVGLARDLNILLIDATDPFGGEKLLPLGRLREPMREIRRADLVVITRSDHPFDEEYITSKIRHYNKDVHVVFAYHNVLGLVPIKGNDLIEIMQFSFKPVVTMAGIAHPDVFFRDLSHYQIAVLRKFTFPDHYAFSLSDVEAVMAAAKQLNAEAVITTQKDAIKLAALDIPDFPFYYLKIQAAVDDVGRYMFYLESALGRYGR